jgi:hypothetical protein
MSVSKHSSNVCCKALCCVQGDIMHSRTLWTLYNVSYLLARGVSNRALQQTILDCFLFLAVKEICSPYPSWAMVSVSSWFCPRSYQPGRFWLVWGRHIYIPGIETGTKLLQRVLLPQVHTWLVVISGWFCLRPYQPGRVRANSIDTIVDTRCRLYSRAH